MTTATTDPLSTTGELEYLRVLVTAAHADGMPALAAVYADMAAVYERQLAAEARIDAAANKYAVEMIANGRDMLEGFEMDRYGITRLGKERRFEAAMAKSNLYLAIRNAVYFEEAS